MALEKQTKAPETEGQRQHSDETASVNRRRLIKGAFAAPMILTLHSGAAVAARTSNEMTIGPIPDPVQPDDVCITPTDSTVDNACTTFLPFDNSDIGTKCDLGDGYVITDQQGQDCVDNGGFIATTSSGCSLVPGRDQCL